MSYKPKEVFCEDCKKLFLKTSANQIRCPKCQKEYRKKQDAEKLRERNHASKPKKRKKPNICTKARSCKYGGRFRHKPCCDYMIKTGQRRPCPAGECTVYAPGKPAKKGGSLSLEG